MVVYVLEEQRHSANRVAFISRDIRKVKKVLREQYKINKDDIDYLFDWKELYSVMADMTLRIEQVEMDKFINL